QGTMILNYGAVNQLSKSEYVTYNASDLYTSNSVSLYGIKMHNEYSSERLMLELTSVFKAASSPLYKPFLKIIKGRESVIPILEKYQYFDNMGIVAYVQGRKILVGNRRLLTKNSILPPSQVIEDRYTTVDRYVTYVAVDGKLCATLVVTYKPTRKTIATLQEL
ncbi:MAG: hypothetical protein Q4B14_05110, partial [Clostridia bacterium]|nr:hypothetical protein [Clostridia bacterium]